MEVVGTSSSFSSSRGGVGGSRDLLGKSGKEKEATLIAETCEIEELGKICCCCLFLMFEGKEITETDRKEEKDDDAGSSTLLKPL